MARDVSPLRPARPCMRLSDTDHITLIRYAAALEAYIEYLTEEKAKTNR